MRGVEYAALRFAYLQALQHAVARQILSSVY